MVKPSTLIRYNPSPAPVTDNSVVIGERYSPSGKFPKLQKKIPRSVLSAIDNILPTRRTCEVRQRRLQGRGPDDDDDGHEQPAGHRPVKEPEEERGEEEEEAEGPSLAFNQHQLCVNTRLARLPLRPKCGKACVFKETGLVAMRTLVKSGKKLMAWIVQLKSFPENSFDSIPSEFFGLRGSCWISQRQFHFSGELLESWYKAKEKVVSLEGFELLRIILNTKTLQKDLKGL